VHFIIAFAFLSYAALEGVLHLPMRILDFRRGERGYRVCSSGYAATDTS
jgi:hypothetical protein